jgi:hypothetical protein
VYLKEHGVDKTAEFIRTVPDYPMNRLVGAASVLIEDGDPQVALPALMLIAKQCPQTTMVQVKLGQALALIGDRQAALAAYRKAGERLWNT